MTINIGYKCLVNNLLAITPISTSPERELPILSKTFTNKKNIMAKIIVTY